MQKQFYWLTLIILLLGNTFPILAQDDAEDIFFEQFLVKPQLRRQYSADTLRTIALRFLDRAERKGKGLDFGRGKLLGAAALNAEGGDRDSAMSLLNDAETYYLQHPREYFTRQNGLIQLYRAGLYINLTLQSLAIIHGQHAQEIFSKTGDALNEGSAHIVIGNAELLRENYSAALKHYLEAQKLKMNSPDSSERYDPTLQMNIVNVYVWMGQLEHALRTCREAIRFLSQHKISASRYPNTYVILGTIHQRLGNQDSAIYFFERAISLGKSNSLIDPMIGAMYYLANVHRERGEFNKSNQIAKNALAIKSNSDSELLLTLLIARNFMSVGHYDSARTRIRTLLNVFPKETYTLEILQLNEVMADLFRHENKKDSLIKYLDRVSALKNEIHSAENQRKISSIYAEMETLASQQQIKFLEQQKQIDEADKRALQFILLLGGVSSVFLIIILIIQYRSRQRHQELKNYKLEAELKQQTASLHAQAVKMIYVNNAVGEVEDRLKKIKREGSEAAADVQQVLNGIQYSKNLEKEWANFETYFGNVHANFYKQFTTSYPNLTVTEKRLAALIKMNLTNSEIAGLLKIETGSVKTAKHRLKKKLGATEEQDLYDFLLTFDQ